MIARSNGIRRYFQVDLEQPCNGAGNAAGILNLGRLRNHRKLVGPKIKKDPHRLVDVWENGVEDLPILNESVTSSAEAAKTAAVA